MTLPDRMSVPRPFNDRSHAGQVLARGLGAYHGRSDVLILALPRGGVPVGFEVARALGAPLDVFLVRKLGVPGHEELAMGAIATGEVRVLNDEVVRTLAISDATIDRVTAVETAELRRRERDYRDDRPPPETRGRTVILVDDGLATGSTMLAAIAALRMLAPAAIVVAVPVAAPEIRDTFRPLVDEIVCAVTPQPFHAVGVWYDDFSPTTDDEVRDLLRKAGRPPGGAR